MYEFIPIFEHPEGARGWGVVCILHVSVPRIHTRWQGSSKKFSRIYILCGSSHEESSVTRFLVFNLLFIRIYSLYLIHELLIMFKGTVS
jgi:hypothetical protein